MPWDWLWSYGKGTAGVDAPRIGEIYHGGAGYRRADLAATSPSKLITSEKYALAIPVVYLPAVILTKLALLVMYTRIFIKRTDLIACWVVAALLITNFVGAMIAGFLMCVPLEYLWNRSIPGGHCININAWYRWSSLMNIITDVVMLILPLPVIWKIQTSRRVKIGITITFATGSMWVVPTSFNPVRSLSHNQCLSRGLITSIIRFLGFFSEDAVTDVTWHASKLIILTIVETGVYLIAACLPTFRPLAVFFCTRKPVPFLGHLGSGANTIDSGLPQARGQLRKIDEIPLTSLTNCNNFTRPDTDRERRGSSRQSSGENSRGDGIFVSQTQIFSIATPTPREFNC